MSRKGFTLIELLVVIAILGLLAAVLFPVFAHVRENGRRTACLSNERQISIAITAYAQDHDNFFPPAITSKDNWANAVLSYAPAKDIFRCPSCPVPDSWDMDVPGTATYIDKGYAINASLYDVGSDGPNNGPPLPVSRVRFPSSTVLICEYAYEHGPGGITLKPNSRLGPDDGEEMPSGYSFIGISGALRHNGGSNYAFIDGHARWYFPQQVLRSKQGNDGARPSFAL